MDGFGAVAEGGVDDFIGAEIAFRRGRGAEVHGFVGHADGERGAVGVGIDAYAGDIQLAEPANQADGDFAAISNENLAEHKGPIVAGWGQRGSRGTPAEAD